MSTTAQDEAIQEFVESMPSTSHLGIEILELGGGRARLRMHNRPELTFNGAVVQGGIVATLADYAAVAACGTLLDEGWLMATTGAETHNLAAADGSMLIAVAEVIKPGRRLAVARADVFNDSHDGVRCLTGLFTATGVAVAT